MPTYNPNYAQEHLFELFDEARSGAEVILVRADGRSCELMPLAEIPLEEPEIATLEIIPDEAETGSGELVPA